MAIFREHKLLLNASNRNGTGTIELRNLPVTETVSLIGFGLGLTFITHEEAGALRDWLTAQIGPNMFEELGRILER